MNSDPGIPTVAPEDVGLSAVRLRRIDDAMRRYVDEGKLVSIVTIVCRQGKVAHFECFGTQDQKVPTQRDTIFRIYSMTKPIATVAAMMLYEEGLFQLDDPVADYIPELKDVKGFAGAGVPPVDLARPITIRHLMTHTSGLTYGFLGTSPVDAMYNQAKILRPDHSTKQMVQTLATLPLVNQPGEAWRYSVSTDVLGHFVEVVSGMSLDAFFRTRILEPLGMVDTGFWVREGQGHRFATNYGPAQDGGIRVIDDPATSRFSRPQKFFSGGSGLVSTAADYCRFCHLLLDKGTFGGARLLGRKTVELMTMNHLPAAIMPISLGLSGGLSELPGEGFGLGGAVLLDVPASGSPGSVGTFRWGGAATTAFWVDYREELVGLLLTQFMPANHYRIRSEFKTLVYQAVVE